MCWHTCARYFSDVFILIRDIFTLLKFVSIKFCSSVVSAGPGHEPRPLPYGLHPPPHTVDPYHLYHPGSREHLEIELEREKRERDARERELRERELRELELREKIKNEIEMKPPGE